MSRLEVASKYDGGDSSERRPLMLAIERHDGKGNARRDNVMGCLENNGFMCVVVW